METYLPSARRGGCRDVFISPGDGHRATARHRVAGIDHEVEQRAFELASSTSAIASSLGVFDDQLNVVGKDAANRRSPADSEGPRSASVLASRSAGVRASAAGARDRRRRSAARRTSFRHSSTSSAKVAAELGHLGAADDDGERIVEVVRDAAGHPGQRFDTA